MAILVVPLILSGCGIPPAVSIASYALDGVVLAASGKTVRDHALSAAVGQDCSMFRVVSGNPICSDYQPTAAAAAALDAMPTSESALATTADGRVIRVAVAPVPGLAPDMTMTAGITSAIEPVPAPRAAVAAESPLMTTRDGRVIRVAGQPAAVPASGPMPVSIARLEWVAPAHGGATTQ